VRRVTGRDGGDGSGGGRDRGGGIEQGMGSERAERHRERTAENGAGEESRAKEKPSTGDGSARGVWFGFGLVKSCSIRSTGRPRSAHGGCG
jgi:hypothetical protein